MLKSLLVVLLVLSGLNFALAGDWKILTNGSEYRVSKESAPFTETPYTIQDGLELTKKEIADFMANKKKDVYHYDKGEVIHKVFNKWYTHETITREYQGYGLKDNRIVSKLHKEEVEVFNPVLYLVLSGILLLVISTEFKSKGLRLATGDMQADFSKEELARVKKMAAGFEAISILMTYLITIIAVIFYGYSISSFLAIIVIIMGVVCHLIWLAKDEKSLIPNFFGIATLAMVSIAILF